MTAVLIDINNVGEHIGVCGGETQQGGGETTKSVAQNMTIIGIS